MDYTTSFEETSSFDTIDSTANGILQGKAFFLIGINELFILIFNYEQPNWQIFDLVKIYFKQDLARFSKIIF